MGGRSRRCITPSNVQFFNTNWKCTGDKSMLARILTGITRVPEHILEDGLLETAPVSLKSCRGSLSDDLHRGQSILSDGAAGREYANAVWRRQESVSSSSSARPTTKASLRKDTTHRMCGLATSSRTIRDCSETKLFDHDEFIQSPKNDRSCPRLIQIAWARSPSRIAASISECAFDPIVGLTPSFKPTCRTKSEFLVTIILTLWNSVAGIRTCITASLRVPYSSAKSISDIIKSFLAM